MDGSFPACCGACGHAAEVLRAGGAAPNQGPHLAVARAVDGAPLGVSLVVRSRSGAPVELPVNKARVVLGRREPADLVIDDMLIARRQCAFDFSTGEAFVEDLDSSCGTYVNGEQIGRARALRAGDVVRVGDSVIEVRTVG